MKLLEPSEETLTQSEHTEWLKRAKAAKPIIDNVIESVVQGSNKAYQTLSEKKFEETRFVGKPYINAYNKSFLKSCSMKRSNGKSDNNPGRIRTTILLTDTLTDNLPIKYKEL